MEPRQAKSIANLCGVVLSTMALSCGDDPKPGGGFGEDGTSSGGDDGSTGADVTTGEATTNEVDTTGGVQPPKYDIGGIPDAPLTSCGGTLGGGGDPLFSYIWISNSGEGTVSKIDTITLEEVGRYRTHPGFGDPSRTSVGLGGDVAVANRNGGLVKFYADPARCTDRNGDGDITTSTGPQNVLPWDEEECRAWFVPLEFQSNRPVAWTPGEWDPVECRYRGEKVWTAGASDGVFDGVQVILVDGDTGAIDRVVKIPEVIPQYYGIYGGAVDAEGNFWGSQLGIGDLVNVDLETLEYRVFPMASGGYGMTVDSKGRVWTCSYEVGRFDPETEQWDVATVGGSGGCMEDGEGTLWLASTPVVGVDTDTMTVVATLQIPEYVHGISVDFQGYVWAVSMGNSAYRIDPITGGYDTVSGLNYPYTYSDMTGFALANAVGWSPAG